MYAAITPIRMPPVGRLSRLLGFTVPSSLLVFFVTFGDVVHSFELVEPAPLELHGFTLAYYRPPARSHFQDRTLDAFGSFQKDENGNLLIAATGTNRFSNRTGTTYLGYQVHTLKGTPIEIYQESPCRSRLTQSNCHGYTFLDGAYWVFGSQVETILADNGWVAVESTHAQPGDVAVYRESNGRVCHTARVTGRDASGQVLVTSKSGFSNVRELRAVEALKD